MRIDKSTLYPQRLPSPPTHAVLAIVSNGYPPHRGRLSTCYSPVRHFPPQTSTEVSIRSFTFDLHVLGTPPAFILSQDQTLRKDSPSRSLPLPDACFPTALRTLVPRPAQKLSQTGSHRTSSIPSQARTSSYHSLVVNVPCCPPPSPDA
jgi:hypothetical protein